jgi:hypothetical protein
VGLSFGDLARLEQAVWRELDYRLRAATVDECLNHLLQMLIARQRNQMLPNQTPIGRQAHGTANTIFHQKKALKALLAGATFARAAGIMDLAVLHLDALLFPPSLIATCTLAMVLPQFVPDLSRLSGHCLGKEPGTACLRWVAALASVSPPGTLRAPAAETCGEKEKNEPRRLRTRLIVAQTRRIFVDQSEPAPLDAVLAHFVQLRFPPIVLATVQPRRGPLQSN